MNLELGRKAGLREWNILIKYVKDYNLTTFIYLINTYEMPTVYEVLY